MNTYKILLAVMFILGGTIFAQDTLATHTIGEKFGGGTVFYVTPSGQHGKVVVDTDIGPIKSFQGGDFKSPFLNPELISVEAREFADWRYPTLQEMDLLATFSKTFGGFREAYYADEFYVLFNRLSKGSQIGRWLGKGSEPLFGSDECYLRLVRSF